MPEPRPLHPRYGYYDIPPSSESTPRSRRPGLHRALQETNDLARGTVTMADIERRPRATLLSPVSRRRQRSPTDEGTDSVEDLTESVFGEALAAATSASRRSRREMKRRRVDREGSAGLAVKPPIKYGYYGQVEPGRLELDLISCDGGEHHDQRHPELYLGPKNLLQHNKAVYCSEAPVSNIVLRHADDTPFCLEKLHVVGPEHGFTAPVREGIVYIAMDFQDLLKYLQTDSISERPGSTRRRSPSPHARRHRSYVNSLRSSPERLTLSDALRDPEVNAAMEHLDRDYARGADSAHDLAAEQESYYGADFGFGRTDAEAHCEIPVLSSDDPDLIVGVAEGENGPVTLLSDEDVGPEESSSQEVLDFRLRRLRLMQRRYEMENWDREDRYAGLNGLHFSANDRAQDRDREGSYGLSRLDALMARSRVQDSPYPHQRSYNQSPAPPTATLPSASTPPLSSSSSSRPRYQPQTLPPPHASDLADAWAKADNDERRRRTEGATALYNLSNSPLSSSNNARDEKVTTARFSIKKGKHKVAIKFEPAISGRFILVKVWSGVAGRGGGNVDVQSIVAKGFGGPRFFPAREMA